MVFSIAVYHLSHLGEQCRRDDPPKLYKDELPQNELSFTERRKQEVATAIKVEMAVMKFATIVNNFTAFLEKLRYLVMLRDPYISLLCGGLLVVTVLSGTVVLAVLMLVFGQLGPFLFIWTWGCFILLPNSAQARLYNYYSWLEEQSMGRLCSYFGWTTSSFSFEMLACFWARIPDGLEAQHCDIFDRYCMVPSISSPATSESKLGSSHSQ